MARLILAAGLLLLYAGTVAAADDSKTLSNVQVSGMADIYFSYNFNKPDVLPQSPINAQSSYRGAPGTQTPLRNFDMRHNQFTLNMAEITLIKKADAAYGRIDFDFGDIADVTNRDENNNVDEVNKHIGQAVIVYNPTQAVTVTLGKMPTHMGWETTKARDNWQYSRSFIYTLGVPYWHMGGSVAAVAIPDKLSFTGYIYDGWNRMYVNNSTKTWGAQVFGAPLPGLSLYYNLITGPNKFNDNRDFTTLHEIIATYAFLERYGLALDFLAGNTKNPNGLTGGTDTSKWSGLELAVKADFTSWYSLGLRCESYWDPQGYSSGASQTLDGVTLTQKFAVNDSLEYRVELRKDASNTPFFKRGDSAVKGQATATASAIFTF